MAFKREDWDILPPETLLAAMEYLYVKAYGGRRYEAYELSAEGMIPLSRRQFGCRDLVKNSGAFEDIIDLSVFLDKLGRRVQNDNDWRGLIDWEELKKRKRLDS